MPGPFYPRHGTFTRVNSDDSKGLKGHGRTLRRADTNFESFEGWNFFSFRSIVFSPPPFFLRLFLFGFHTLKHAGNAVRGEYDRLARFFKYPTEDKPLRCCTVIVDCISRDAREQRVKSCFCRRICMLPSVGEFH